MRDRKALRDGGGVRYERRGVEVNTGMGGLFSGIAGTGG